MCGKSILKNIANAKQKGYFIELHYIGVESADIARERVAERVKKGGHGISEKDIERRYIDTFHNLKIVLPECNLAVFYDNTIEFRRFAIYKNGIAVRISHNVPNWYERFADAHERSWADKPVSLLKTTQNTRDLGGYRTKDGTLTKEKVLLRSDVQNYPSEEDLDYLKRHGITTVIDMRGAGDVARKPSGFAEKDGFEYYNFQIEEGSGVPESVAAVPKSYMNIASAKAMPKVFRCIANAKTGVMFNCTAGKDRTGVVSAILLLHAGVSDKDVVDDYVLTKEYGRERLELIHKNFPNIDMNIVTPCEMFMEEFLRSFRRKYGDTEKYFKSIGLSDKEIQMLLNKLV